MTSNNRLRLAGGTDAPSATIFDNGTGSLVPTGIIDENGNHYFRAKPTAGTGQTGGPSSGGHDVELATLKQRLNGAFLWLGLLTIASGIAFLFLLGRVDTVNQNVSGLQSSVAGQTATLQAVKESLDRLDEKLDGKLDRKK